MPQNTFAAARLRFAVDIRTRRRLLGLSQAALARRVNVAYSYVSMLERAERLPSYEMIVALANVLDTTPSALCGPAGDPAASAGYERQLVDFARSRGLSRRQVNRLIAVGRAMFKLPDDPDLAS